MARLVGAAAKVAEANIASYAVIGGVAVSVRLGQAHRSTADIDAVVDELTPPPIPHRDHSAATGTHHARKRDEEKCQEQ